MYKRIALCRVVLVAETAAKKTLVEIIERLRFDSYSVVPCEGRGSRGIVPDLLAESSHVRIEALGPGEAVDDLMNAVQDFLEKKFSITCFTDSVSANALPAYT